MDFSNLRPPKPDPWTPYPVGAMDIRRFIESTHASPLRPLLKKELRPRPEFVLDSSDRTRLPFYDMTRDKHLAPYRAKLSKGRGLLKKIDGFDVALPYLVAKKGLSPYRLPITTRFKQHIAVQTGKRRRGKRRLHRRIAGPEGTLITESVYSLDSLESANVPPPLSPSEGRPEFPIETSGVESQHDNSKVDEGAGLFDKPNAEHTAKKGEVRCESDSRDATPPGINSCSTGPSADDLTENGIGEPRIRKEFEVTSLINILPLPITAHILAYMPGPTVMTTLFTSIGSQHLPEVISSLWQSGALEAHWTATIAEHRRVRREALAAGDLKVSVECSSYPPELGDVDADIPVWKNAFEEEDHIRIENEDAILRVRHIRMFRHLLAILMGDEVDHDDYENLLSMNIEGETTEEVEGDEEKGEFAKEEKRLLDLALKESLVSEPTAPPTGVVLPPLSCLSMFGASSSLNDAALAIVSAPASVRLNIRCINLDGCADMTSETITKLAAALPNLRSIRANGLEGLKPDSASTIGSLKNLKYLDLSNSNLNDETTRSLCVSLSSSGSIRYLSIANAALTDSGMKHLGSTVAKHLVDFCMAGCFRVTDNGCMLMQLPNLRRFNYCGSYKVTDASRRYILSQYPQLLIYNKSTEFGLLGYERLGSGFWEVAKEASQEAGVSPSGGEGADGSEGKITSDEEDLEAFRRRMTGL